METEEIVYGRNTVLEYLKSSIGGQATLYISATAHGKIIDRIKDEAKKKNVPVVVSDRDFFTRIDSSSKHQGVAITLPRRETVSHGDLIERAKLGNGLILLLDQLNDPQNIGSIIRTAEALGCSGVVMTKTHSPGITPAVIKASSGATAHIEILIVPNAADFIDRASDAGLWIIGSSDRGDTEPAKARELKPAVLVIGSEGKGMRSLVGRKCHCTVRISLKGKVSSVNASVAAGILMYELLKEE